MSTQDNLRKSAKRWLKALRDGDGDARARFARAYPSASGEPTLRDVQHALARERGYENWTALVAAASGAPVSDSDLQSLLRAASDGDADELTRILDRRPDLINLRGVLPGHSGLRTALHFGVQHESVVRTLLDRGADPNIRDEGDNACPIHFAAERGEMAIVKLLVEHGADPSAPGTTHLLDAPGWAVCFDYANHIEIARLLIERGAPYTIFTAAALGEPDVIRDLVRGGANPDERMDRTNHARTPLHLAVLKNQPAAVEALISAGGNLDAPDAAGLTPLDTAALSGETAIAQLLVDAGARVELAAAIVLDRADDLERLFREQPTLHVDNRRWARMLVHACAHSPVTVVEKLLRAARRYRGGLSVVNLADDEETAVDGARRFMPLHAAAFAGHTDVVKLLLQAGADPRVRDSRWRATPAGWARYAGHDATADVILDTPDIDIFEAIAVDSPDRVARILDSDPAALDRPFESYCPDCGVQDHQWWPAPDATPLDWATSQKKTNALRVLHERGAGARSAADIERAKLVVTFLQSACWDHHTHGKADHRLLDRAAQRILAEHPDIARDSLYTAIVCGDIDDVRRILADRPELARERGGSRRWTPILYSAYTRFTHPETSANAVEIARVLLDHGANPNDFYMAGDAHYSVLTGIAGEGEQDSPRQPYAAEMFELLLERGAEPFDIQVLYDTHFHGDMLWWLELVYKHTINTARGAAWKDPEWKMLDMGGYGSGARFILEMAIRHRDMRLAEWALERGANPNSAPARDKRWHKHSLYELALLDRLPHMAELFIRFGAARTTPALSDEEQFLDACFRLDRARAATLLQEHPEYLKAPHAMFEAAKRDRPDVLALLLDLGFPLEIQDNTGKRALHAAALANGVRAAQFLIERGAEIDPRESTYGGAPIGWASHGDQLDVMDLLSRHSKAIWTLCFRAYVDRLREVLHESPELARQVSDEGVTPLWWLPDDDEKAMEIVELLLAAGADPSVRSRDGRTAADWARRRGMTAVAERLDRARTARVSAS